MFLPLIFVMCSCDPVSYEIEIEVPVEDNFQETKDYPLEKIISWDSILSLEGEYFVYIFSYRCFYCNQIKDLILTYNEVSSFTFYFVEFVDEIPIKREIEDTIGLKEISEVFIKGVPSLLEVKNGEIIGNYAGSKEIADKITNS